MNWKFWKAPSAISHEPSAAKLVIRLPAEAEAFERAQTEAYLDAPESRLWAAVNADVDCAMVDALDAAMNHRENIDMWKAVGAADALRDLKQLFHGREQQARLTRGQQNERNS